MFMRRQSESFTLHRVHERPELGLSVPWNTSSEQLRRVQSVFSGALARAAVELRKEPLKVATHGDVVRGLSLHFSSHMQRDKDPAGFPRLVIPFSKLPGADQAFFAELAAKTFQILQDEELLGPVPLNFYFAAK